MGAFVIVSLLLFPSVPSFSNLSDMQVGCQGPPDLSLYIVPLVCALSLGGPYDADSTALPAEHAVPAHARVLKKPAEVLGQEEPSRVDYVMRLVKQDKQPAQMVDTLSAIMDNETEPFVLNLFRLIIMESEKAAQGLL